MRDGDSLQGVVAREIGDVDGWKNWVMVGHGRWRGGDIQHDEWMVMSFPQERVPSLFGTH